MIEPRRRDSPVPRAWADPWAIRAPAILQGGLSNTRRSDPAPAIAATRAATLRSWRIAKIEAATNAPYRRHALRTDAPVRASKRPGTSRPQSSDEARSGVRVHDQKAHTGSCAGA